MKSKNSQPPKILSGTEENCDVSFLKSFHLHELLRKENNAFKKNMNASFVKNSLERNLRSVDVFFFFGKKKKKKTEKNKLAAWKLNQLLTK